MEILKILLADQIPMRTCDFCTACALGRTRIVRELLASKCPNSASNCPLKEDLLSDMSIQNGFIEAYNANRTSTVKEFLQCKTCNISRGFIIVCKNWLLELAKLLYPYRKSVPIGTSRDILEWIETQN